MKKALILSALAFAIPLVSFAQTTVSNITDVGGVLINIINFIVVPVIFAIAFIVFIWGAFQVFIMGANDADVKSKGKNHMLWGLIGFFVMVSVWGLVNILIGSFNFGGGTSGPQGGLPYAGQVGQ